MSTAVPRILVVNNSCSLSAGTTQSLLLLLRYLQGKFQFSVAAPCYFDDLPTALRNDGIPFHALSEPRLPLPIALTRIVAHGRYDLVYANNLSEVGIQAFLAATLARLPFVWHVREPVTNHPQTRGLRFRSRLKAVLWFGLRSWALKRAPTIIANSRHTAETLASVAGVRLPVCVPNGIEPLEFDADRAAARAEVLRELSLPPDTLLVINVGILCRRKNQVDAVEVVRIVKEKHPETRLVCIGIPASEGSEYAAGLRARITQLRLTDGVYLLGLRNDVARYLRASDVLLHTSLNEPQGRVILEAMAARLPVVAYRVGGVPESVVDRETGFLVPTGDVGAAAEAVCGLMADSALRHRMGEAGRRRVLQHFTAEASARKVGELIESILSARAQSCAREQA